MPTTQTVQIVAYDYGPSLSSVTLRSLSDDSLVATADTCNEVTADSGLYAAVFGETAVIPAGNYRLRAVVSGAPLNRYVTLAGTDGEVVQSSSVPPDASLTAKVDAIGVALAGGSPVEPTVATVFELLESTYAFASQISGSRIAHVGPVKPGGDIELIKGKDYTVASDSVLPIAVPDTAGALYADLTSGTLAASKAFGARRDNGDATIAGTISSVSYASNVTTINVEVADTQLPDSLTEGDDWTYMIQRTTEAGKDVVVAQGNLTVKPRVV